MEYISKLIPLIIQKLLLYLDAFYLLIFRHFDLAHRINTAPKEVEGSECPGHQERTE